MALKATIFKADLQVNDLERHVYEQHPLTIARHPSETDERMMVRVLAFALRADHQLRFSKGLSNVDEPDLWQHGDHGQIQLWIDLGLPDAKRIKKACSQAERVFILAYGGNKAALWWQEVRAKAQTFNNLEVLSVSADDSAALAALANKNMQLTVTIDELSLMIQADDSSLDLQLNRWQ